MAQQAMTVRLDALKKARFDALCEQFGMSANTAINIFVNAVVRSKSIPFSINVKEDTDEKEEIRKKAISAIESMRKQAEESGASEMTLDEINEEIRLAREERKM